MSVFDVDKTDPQQVAGPDSRWRPESAVRAALAEHWDMGGDLERMEARPNSLTWRSERHVVKLAVDSLAHCTAGLLASEAIDQEGIATGAPVRTRDAKPCVQLGAGSWVLSVLRRVRGNPLSIHQVQPEVLGDLLGRLHHIMKGCTTTGAWTPDDVLGHMSHGINPEQPAVIRQMISDSINTVRDHYATAPTMQLIYGDGPGILSANGIDINAIIDWGAVRHASIADDIGCWTAHGATDQISLPVYTAAFLRGYRRTNTLPTGTQAAIPLFQRLRIASRACYATDSQRLVDIKAWMQHAFGSDSDWPR